MKEKEVKFEILKGQIFDKIEKTHNAIYFYQNNYHKYSLLHDDICCESVILEDEVKLFAVEKESTDKKTDTATVKWNTSSNESFVVNSNTSSTTNKSETEQGKPLLDYKILLSGKTTNIF